MPPLYCHKNRASLVGSPPAGLAPFLGAVSPVPPPDLSIKRLLSPLLLAYTWSNFVHVPAPPCSLVIKFCSCTSFLLLICDQISFTHQLPLAHLSSKFDHAPAYPHSYVIKFRSRVIEFCSRTSSFLLIRHQNLFTHQLPLAHPSSKFDHVRHS